MFDIMIDSRQQTLVQSSSCLPYDYFVKRIQINEYIISSTCNLIVEIEGENIIDFYFESERNLDHGILRNDIVSFLSSLK